MRVVTDSTAGCDVTNGGSSQHSSWALRRGAPLLSRNFHRHEQHRGTNLLGSHRHIELSSSEEHERELPLDRGDDLRVGSASSR
jgi:hypothetical protein